MSGAPCGDCLAWTVATFAGASRQRCGRVRTVGVRNFAFSVFSVVIIFVAVALPRLYIARPVRAASLLARGVAERSPSRSPVTEPRSGRRTALNLPLLPPQQKNRSPAIGFQPENAQEEELNLKVLSGRNLQTRTGV